LLNIADHHILEGEVGLALRGGGLHFFAGFLLGG
jgi:hypothetical protein